LGTVYGKTNTFKDAKHLDVSGMTIYRPQHDLKNLGVSRTDNVQVDPVKCWHIKAVILLRHHDVIAIKRPETWFAVCLMHLKPEIVLKRR